MQYTVSCSRKVSKESLDGAQFESVTFHDNTVKTYFWNETTKGNVNDFGIVQLQCSVTYP